MSPADLHGGETAEELLFLGAALAHVELFYRLRRLERIMRQQHIARRSAERERRPVRSFA